MAERYHACVADQEVRRHREQAPDQDFGDQPAPELRQYQRRNDQQCNNDAKARPIDCSMAQPHLVAVARRPVGRNSRVRINTTKETMIAWAGLTQSEAYASNRLMKIAAAIDPARLPMPPTTTTMKALRIQSKPIAWLTPTSGPNSTPLAPAIAAPIANTAVSTHGTGMPIAWAITRSCVVALIQTPKMLNFRNSHSAPMIAAESSAMTKRYQG